MIHREARRAMARLRQVSPLVVAGALVCSAPAWGKGPVEPVDPAGEEDPAASFGPAPLIEIKTPPADMGAVEFDPEATGLIKTETFEVPTEEEVQEAESAEGDEEAAPLKLKGKYQGIVPGSRDTLPEHRRFLKSRRAYVTWVGFQPRGNGRVFLRVNRPVAFNLVQTTATEYHLDLQGARLAHPNERRRLDTSHFDGVVKEVKARNIRHGVRLTVSLKKPAVPLVRQQGDYVYVDFR